MILAARTKFPAPTGAHGSAPGAVADVVSRAYPTVTGNRVDNTEKPRG